MPYEPTTITTILKQIKQVFNDQEADFVFRALTGKRYVDWFLTGENPNLDSDKFIKILEKKAEQPELPVQYLFKKAYFLNWELYIDQRAMIPRFETEELVMKAYHRLCQIKSPGEVRFIIDLGTGSGAIAIALAFLLPRAFIFATDVSKSALAVAQINVVKFGLK
ncbi:MAG: 50S ribosomal protein L11 methyltransferase, partial [candidate division WOR-3 bacterium]|nr:50S ribosomal protein L11 methyltransferase [candidate division WOR-3 bacterium]